MSGLSYLYSSADDAVCDPVACVDARVLQDYGVFELGVLDGAAVDDAGVGADVGVWVYLAFVSDLDGASKGRVGVDDGAITYRRSSLWRG